MIKVEMKTLSCGPNGTLRPGEVYELPDEEAKQLIEGRYAKIVVDSVPETEPAKAKILDGDEDDEPSNEDVDENDPDQVLARMREAALSKTSEKTETETTPPETPPSEQ